MTENKQGGGKPRRALLWLRGICVFFIAAVLLCGVYWYCLHHYKNAAVFVGEDDPRDAFIYEEKTYYAAAPIGAHGITEIRYPKGDCLGEVKPSLGLTPGHTYLLYAVKDKVSYLLLTREDGKNYVYYVEDRENPYKGEPETQPDDDDYEWSEDGE